MSHSTRREFLENSMFAFAAAAAGSVAPQVLQAAPAASPNSKLRVAVLGVNGRGGTHISNFLRREDCDIVAIVDPDEAVGQKRVEQIAGKQGSKPSFHKDLRRVMEDPNIDVISIATPNHWHSLATIWAVQNKKYVYVEKPVSHNVTEGRRAVQAARKHGVIVQCGTQSRSHQSHQEAMAFIHNGGIGEVKLARGLCYKRRKSIGPRGNYDVPASVDYNVYLGPADEEPLTRQRFHYDWHWQWNCGNGDIGNQGIHQMDIARWGLGINDLGDRVVSYGGRLGYEDAGETANTQVSIHDSGDKRIIFETRGLETDGIRGAKIGVIFYGSEGYLVSTSNYSSVTAFDLDGNPIKTFKGGNTSQHFDNFVEAVKANDQSMLNCDIEEGHISSALCHLGNISYKLGETMDTAELRAALGDDEQAVESLDRTVQHLTNNDVNADRTPMALGPALALNGKEEVFVGSHASAANPLLFREGRGEFQIPDEASL
ncbi:Alpha-N-acetylgalactosaminidase [Maioricimonas rarisocia]|uniref:Alpha-N-acetylgalactosaminidase n=1 Tax=Maioricimonas rarisocia TaxID=2528026 RepID=A0A517Z9S3_9PLAN|nr:Gfo/Idh/MocA family oxidoreductase [Maioricimonas rarisocia]QDU39236.1 Alpha-N-acetylgalactosaminidase [Maioricimonas rarisocia]